MTGDIVSADEAQRRFNARAAVIGGLETLTQWLTTHVTAPVPDRVRIQVSISVGAEPDRIAEVERFARSTGTYVESDPYGVRACLVMGPVEYVVYAPTDGGRELYLAESSYRGSVTP